MMGTLERFAPPPPAAITRVLSTFARSDLESFIAVAIDLLDLAEPDSEGPDFTPRSDGLPGDPDDTEGNGDDQGDQSAIEWTTMRWSQKGGPNIVGHEDVEDDDPAEEDDDDSAVDDRPCDDQFQDQEPDEAVLPAYGLDQSTGPTNLNHDLARGDREIMGPHVDRIRRTRCIPVGTSFWGAREWRLRDPKA